MLMTEENRNTWLRTCTSATLSNINSTWTGLGSNPGLHNDMPATNKLSHGTAVS
jgi:hypothetical protein